MAEEVGNFPLDQGNTNALRGLEQAREEAGRPRRLDDAEEDVRNPNRTQEAAEEREGTQTESLQDRVEITQEAQEQSRVSEQNRTETETQQQESLQEQDTTERQQEQTRLEDSAEETIRESRIDPTPSNSSQRAATAGGGVSDPEEALDEGFRLGNDIADPNRTEEFQTRNQIDDAEEAAQVAGEAEDPLQTRPQRPSISDFGDTAGASDQQSNRIEERIETSGSEVTGQVEVEVQESELSETGANVTERADERRTEEAEEAARNEPPLDIPAPDVEAVVESREPLEESQDTNPLRAPGPSEIRDEPDAAAVETERGQNVSNLI